jgi:hypothetical protein
MTVGRMNSQTQALNIAGKGGQLRALGTAKNPSGAAKLGKGLGKLATYKFYADIGFSLAEGFGCAFSRGY